MISDPSAEETGSPATTIVAATLAVAAGVHLGVALQHGITTRHGVFFLVLGLLQGALMALVVRRASPRLHAIIVAVSTTAVALWAATRLPAFGPREAIGVLDGVTTGLELATIGGGLSLLRLRLRSRPVGTLRTPVLLVAAVVAAMSTNAVPSPHANHHHGHDIREVSGHDDGHGHTEEAGADDGPTIDQPIFGDLFADHHAEPETAREEHPDSDDDHPPVTDGHADAEPHEHPPGNDHAEGG